SPRAVVEAFDNAHDERDLQLARDCGERSAALAIDGDAIRRHSRVRRFHRRVTPDRDVTAAVEPRGIARKPRLRKGDELRSLSGRISGQRARLVGTSGEVGGDFSLDESNAQHTRMWDVGCDDMLHPISYILALSTSATPSSITRPSGSTCKGVMRSGSPSMCASTGRPIASMCSRRMRTCSTKRSRRCGASGNRMASQNCASWGKLRYWSSKTSTRSSL